jgi:hypothetical protein
VGSADIIIGGSSMPDNESVNSNLSTINRNTESSIESELPVVPLTSQTEELSDSSNNHDTLSEETAGDSITETNEDDARLEDQLRTAAHGPEVEDNIISPVMSDATSLVKGSSQITTYAESHFREIVNINNLYVVPNHKLDHLKSPDNAKALLERSPDVYTSHMC